jgi:hypothetical protein
MAKRFRAGVSAQFNSNDDFYYDDFGFYCADLATMQANAGKWSIARADTSAAVADSTTTNGVTLTKNFAASPKTVNITWPESLTPVDAGYNFTVFGDESSAVDNGDGSYYLPQASLYEPFLIATPLDVAKLYGYKSDGTLHVIDPNTMTLLRTVPMPENLSRALVSKDGTRLLLGNLLIDTVYDDIVTTYNLDGGVPVCALPDGEFLLAGTSSDGGSLRRVDQDTGDITNIGSVASVGFATWFHPLAWDIKDGYIALRYGNNAIGIYSLTDASSLGGFTIGIGWANFAFYAPNGCVYTCRDNRDNNIYKYDPATGTTTIDIGYKPNSVLPLRNGGTKFLINRGATADVFDTASDSIVGSITWSDGHNAIADVMTCNDDYTKSFAEANNTYGDIYGHDLTSGSVLAGGAYYPYNDIGVLALRGGPGDYPDEEGSGEEPSGEESSGDEGSGDDGSEEGSPDHDHDGDPDDTDPDDDNDGVPDIDDPDPFDPNVPGGEDSGEPSGEEGSGEEPSGEEGSDEGSGEEGSPDEGSPNDEDSGDEGSIEPSGDGDESGEEGSGEEPSGEEGSGEEGSEEGSGEVSSGDEGSSEEGSEESSGEEGSDEEPSGEEGSDDEPSGDEGSGEEPGEENSGEEGSDEPDSGEEGSDDEPSGEEGSGEEPSGEEGSDEGSGEEGSNDEGSDDEGSPDVCCPDEPPAPAFFNRTQFTLDATAPTPDEDDCVDYYRLEMQAQDADGNPVGTIFTATLVSVSDGSDVVEVEAGQTVRVVDLERDTRYRGRWVAVND